MSVSEKLKELILGYRATSKSYIKHLKKIGVSVGEDVVLYRPLNTTIDIQNPHLLSIGNHVMITGPATILTHDYSWCVIKRKYGEILGNQRPVIIGNNVFIGWGASILAGTRIGDNTIIGANSVVHGDLSGNAVYAGNPAKFLMSLNEYYEKRKERQLEEAVQVVYSYKKRFNKFPDESVLDEYFYLFTNRANAHTLNMFKMKLRLMDNYEKSVAALNGTGNLFKDYPEFIEYCKKEMQKNGD